MIGLPPQPLVPEDVVIWNWPLRDEGLKAWIVLVAAVVVVTLVWAIGANLVFELFTCAMLALALWRLWLPVKWELGLTGVTMVVLGFRRRIPWLSVARYELRDAGVWLFADRAASPQRGTFIAYGGQKQRVQACIQYYLGTWTAATDSTQSFEQPPGK